MVSNQGSHLVCGLFHRWIQSRRHWLVKAGPRLPGSLATVEQILRPQKADFEVEPVTFKDCRTF